MGLLAFAAREGGRRARAMDVGVAPSTVGASCAWSAASRTHATCGERGRQRLRARGGARRVDGRLAAHAARQSRDDGGCAARPIRHERGVGDGTDATALGRGAAGSASASAGDDSTPPLLVEEQPTLARSPWSWNVFRATPHDAEIFRLALPALASVLMEPLMSIVDTAIIGRIGVHELAGTGLAGLMWTIFTVGLFQFLVTAVTPLIAAAQAARDRNAAASGAAASAAADGEATTSVSRILCTGLALACAIAAGVLVLERLGARWMLSTVFHATDDVARHAATYLGARKWSMPFALMNLVCIGAYRGLGDTRTVLASSVVANALNVALDALFIFGWGWGVRGAAASSAISTTLSCVTLLTVLIRRGHLNPRRDLFPLPGVDESGPMLSAGLALSAKSVVTMYTVGLASSAIAQLGAVSLAAHEIIKQLFFFCYIAVEPLSVAGQTMVARARGLGKR